MKHSIKRPIQSTASQIIGVCVALIALVGSVIGGFAVIDGMTTGRVYSVALVFGDSTMVSKDSASIAYWTSMGLFSLSCVGGLIVGIGLLREVVIEHKRKVADAKKNRTTTDSET